ncbi:hypothetical protein BACFIN_07742 [Bacteroides finegoldii DSM 17565]|nr:hypothetical protein BACFIN_07742 [Bacteroides finegoldii DSM 17565]
MNRICLCITQRQLRLKFYFVNAKVYKKSGFKDETGLFFLKSPFMI